MKQTFNIQNMKCSRGYNPAYYLLGRIDSILLNSGFNRTVRQDDEDNIRLGNECNK